MINSICCLPEERFIGGTAQEFRYHIFTKKGTPFNLTDHTAEWSMIDYSDKGGDYPICKVCEITKDIDGNLNVITAKLSAADTINLSGKFIYQLSIKDPSGNLEIPGKGIIYIDRNIDRNFI